MNNKNIEKLVYLQLYVIFLKIRIEFLTIVFYYKKNQFQHTFLSLNYHNIHQ